MRTLDEINKDYNETQKLIEETEQLCKFAEYFVLFIAGTALIAFLTILGAALFVFIK
jgi:hypothetical protein